MSAKTARQTEIAKKELSRICKSHGLLITIEANRKVVDFLDVTLDLNSGEYRPYTKPGNTPLYINKDSNHPPSVLKNIALEVNRRLSSISSNKNVFNQASPPYQRALQQSGFDHKLEYDPPKETNSRKKKTRRRQITWFNPPFSQNVSTNIGRKFLLLLDNCIPPGHPLHKLLNRNTVKISYRTMPNIGQNIARHNAQVLNSDQPKKTTSGCNCQKSRVCPMPGKCQSEGLIYGAKVTQTISVKTETYTGLTENSFKSRYGGHLSNFTHKDSKGTTLSTHIWDLKKKSIEHTLTWEIIARSKGYNPSTGQCRLCLKEKYFILFKPAGATLNARSEFFSSCRHIAKHLMGGKT